MMAKPSAGMVFNCDAGFNVSENGKTGSSVFLFVTAGGTIGGWNPNVDRNNAVIEATNPGAIYLGLAIARDSHGQTLLYAADFANGTIDVYNQKFQLVTTLPGNFTDSQLPADYHPFNIQAINNRLYVEYAPVDKVLDGTADPGDGAVDVYSADGQLQQRLTLFIMACVGAMRGSGSFTMRPTPSALSTGRLRAFKLCFLFSIGPSVTVTPSDQEIIPMALNVPLAVRMTPHYAKSAGWGNQLGEVCGLLGFSPSYPDAKNFVTAVYRWQQTHQLDADGMLGPDTWKKMKPALNTSSAKAPIMGPTPAWVYTIDPAANFTPAKHPAQVLSPKQSDVEDRIIKEMAKVAVEEEQNPLLPVPVSNEYLGRNGYPNGSKTLETTGVISQTLEVGQVWQGLQGKRTIMGLISGGVARNPDGSWGWVGTILFMTESKQGYEQGLRGWESDLMAAVYADVARSLAPIQKMLDIEVAFLMGVISGASMFGAVAMVGLSLAQWSLKNKKRIPFWIDAIDKSLDARKHLQQIAPTLEKKVQSAILSDVWASFKGSLTDPANLARFAGQLLATRGKALLTETFPRLALSFKMVVTGALKDLGSDIGPDLEALAPLQYLKQVKQALGVNPLKPPVGWVGAGVHSLPGEVIRGGEETPGRAVEKGKQLVEEVKGNLKAKRLAELIPTLQKLGADISANDVVQIEQEFRANSTDIVNTFQGVVEAWAAVPPDDD